MPPRRRRGAASAPAAGRLGMFQHRTRSGRAWSCRASRAEGPLAKAPRPSLSPHGAPLADPLHDSHGVEEEEEEDGGICALVKDLRIRRVFTPSSLPMECSPSPDRNPKPGVAHQVGSPHRVDVAEGDGMAEAVADVESSPDAVSVMEEVPEEVGVLERVAEGGEEGLFQTPGGLEEGGIQSTPPDLHVISKSEVPAVDGSDATSQRNGGFAVEGFRHKQKNWSDQSHGRLGIVPCSRMKLVRDPKSFSYRRLLPYLMDLTRSGSNSPEALPWQRHPLKVEQSMVEKSIQLLSSSPAQAKVDLSDLSQKMHKNLCHTGHMKETVDVLEWPGNDAHKHLSGNSKDNICDTVPKLPSSYTEGAKLSPQFNAHELEMICKSSRNLPSTIEGLSVEELGGTQDSSDLPRQPKADSGIIVSRSIKLSTQTSQFGAACPLGVKHSPSMKGILKRHRGGCIGLCTCLDCASFRLHAERAFEFSRKQMQEAEDVAMGLINELACLRKLVENHYAIATCVTRNDIHQHGQVKGVCKRASRAEDLARKHIREMNDDLNFHCRNMRPRVTFSESTEERVISEIETNHTE